MSSLSLVQSCLWTVTRCVPLVQQKLLTFIRAHEFTQPCSMLSLNSDTCVPLVPQKLLTFIRAHEFTQPCSILSLNSDMMGAPSAAKTSYLYQSTWVHTALFNLLFEQWHDGCPYCSRNFLPLSQHMSSPSLVRSCFWTVTRWVPLVQQKLLTFIRAHEFTQPYSILSLNSDTMCAPSAAETYYLYHSTWVHSALFNFFLWTVTRWVPLVQQKLLTFIRAHEFTQPCSILSLNSDTMGAPSAAEISSLYQSTWVHSALFYLVFEQWHDVCP